MAISARRRHRPVAPLGCATATVQGVVTTTSLHSFRQWVPPTACAAAQEGGNGSPPPAHLEQPRFPSNIQCSQQRSSLLHTRPLHSQLILLRGLFMPFVRIAIILTDCNEVVEPARNHPPVPEHRRRRHQQHRPRPCQRPSIALQSS